MDLLTSFSLSTVYISNEHKSFCAHTHTYSTYISIITAPLSCRLIADYGNSLSRQSVCCDFV